MKQAETIILVSRAVNLLFCCVNETSGSNVKFLSTGKHLVIWRATFIFFFLLCVSGRYIFSVLCCFVGIPKQFMTQPVFSSCSSLLNQTIFAKFLVHFNPRSYTPLSFQHVLFFTENWKTFLIILLIWLGYVHNNEVNNGGCSIPQICVGFLGFYER